MAADPVLAVQDMIKQMVPPVVPDDDVKILEYGRDFTTNASKTKYPWKFVVVSPNGGPRNRGYSSKARVQVRVICYAPYGEEAWQMSEAIYNRLNISRPETVTDDDINPTRATCILSILSAGGPQEANLRGIPRAAAQDTYTVLYDSKEKTP